MSNLLEKILKRGFPILTILILLVSTFFFNAIEPQPQQKPPTNPITPVIIDDPNVPLSNMENASFLIAHPGVSFNEITIFTEKMFDYIGDGTILYSGDIMDNAEAVEGTIQSLPDCSEYLSEDEYIEWNYEFRLEPYNYCFVAGEIKNYNGSSKDPSEGKSFIDLTDYGAVGDGISDDNEPLVAAITAATEKNKPLYIPAGDYYSSSMIYINQPITIYGDGADLSRIIFKDDVNKIYVPNDKQRGIMTFNGSGLNIEGIAIEYEANNTTPFTRQAFQSGKEGVLFTLLDSSNVIIKDTYFLVSGNANPSVTCAWFKSELNDISNVIVENCNFENTSSSSVGGALWISAHDNVSTQNCDIKIENNIFSCNCHDEVFGIWGHNINNIEIIGNEFSHPNSDTIMETLVSIGQYDGGYVNNVYLADNTFHINDGLNNAINIQKLSPESNVVLSRNTIEGELSPDSVFNCVGLSSCGSTSIEETYIDILGGSTVSSFAFDRSGNVSVDNLTMNASDCTKCLIIKSRYSTNFTDSAFSISNSNITINSTNEKKAQPTIQFPVSSSFSMSNTDIDTSGSAIHEIVFQTLKAPDQGVDTSELNLDGISTDANIYFTITSDENRRISLSDVDNSNYYFTFSGADAHLNQLDVSGCSYENFYINYKNATPTDLADYTNDLNVD